MKTGIVIKPAERFSIRCNQCEKDKAWPYQTHITMKPDQVYYECSNGHGELTVGEER